MMSEFSKFSLNKDELEDNYIRRKSELIQEELSNNIHCIRTMPVYSMYVNKGTEANDDVSIVQMPKDIFTGTFRDGVRRIDVVLVIRKPNIPVVDDIKINFFTNIVKTGLQIETEAGVMSCHKKITFVKIHAPDAVLEEYGKLFNVESIFLNSRVDVVNPKRTLIENFYAVTKVRNESEWIKLVRKNYKGPLFYSNAERSLIVYKILLLLPFGDYQNYLGLNRLLKKKIILDVYAVHDGPYFFLPNQKMTRVSARQILCYNWVGIKNLFKVQPLNLIHEYFGPRDLIKYIYQKGSTKFKIDRPILYTCHPIVYANGDWEKIGFYFAFYGFYNQALVVATLAGILTTFFEIFDTTDETLKNDTCEADENIWICPECEKFNICPFRKLKDYCDMVSLNIFLDNPFTVFFSIFIVLWATLFVIFWRRREHYWNWMWKIDKRNATFQHTIRPEFEMVNRKIGISKRTGIIKFYESAVRKTLHFFISKFILLVCITGIVLFVAFSLWSKDQWWSSFSENWKTKKHEYGFLAMFQIVYVLLLTMIEQFCKTLSYVLVKYENHRTYISYEMSLVIKLFGYTFAVTFSIILYTAWLKGLYFLLPINSNWSYVERNYFYGSFTSWIKSLTIFKRNCGPFSCINELWILLIVTLFLKQIGFRIFAYFTSLRTDYNQKLSKEEESGSIPTWEREYRLKAITEELMMDKYNLLAQQFGLVTLFVAAFPLAPLFALIINTWDIRYHAHLFLMSSRRPLLLRRSGLGAWTGVFMFISFFAILSNAFTIVRDTRTVLRLYYFSEFGNMTGYLNYTLVSFPTKYYDEFEELRKEIKKYKGEVPSVCYFSGLLADSLKVKEDEKTIYDIHTFYNKPEFTVKIEFSKIKFYQTLFVCIYEHILVCMVVFFYYTIPSRPSELKEIMFMENRIKDT